MAYFLNPCQEPNDVERGTISITSTRGKNDVEKSAVRLGREQRHEAEGAKTEHVNGSANGTGSTML